LLLDAQELSRYGSIRVRAIHNITLSLQRLLCETFRQSQSPSRCLLRKHTEHLVIPRNELKAIALLTAILSISLSACNPQGDGKKASQVAAKVNGDEILSQQIDQALSRAGNIPEAQQKQAQQQVLQRLIDQQLFVQQAIQKKLDREPRVQSAIDAAKRQVLAQAYVDQVIQAASKPTPEQVKAFYSEHPELFRDRRMYRLKELAIAAPADFQPKLRAELERLDKHADKSKIMTELITWLQSQNIKFQANVATQAAEQLPTELIGPIYRMKEGDLLTIPRGNAVVVSQLDKFQSAPLTEEQAAPFIEQFLQNRKRMDLSNEEMKRLRAAAKIEYLGDFAKNTSAEEGSAGAAHAPTAASGTMPQQ
jgi:EpsD family peptidyl-prolyl cis-trans isomerase